MHGPIGPTIKREVQRPSTVIDSYKEQTKRIGVTELSSLSRTILDRSIGGSSHTMRGRDTKVQDAVRQRT